MRFREARKYQVDFRNARALPRNGSFQKNIRNELGHFRKISEMTEHRGNSHGSRHFRKISEMTRAPRQLALLPPSFAQCVKGNGSDAMLRCVEVRETADARVGLHFRTISEMTRPRVFISENIRNDPQHFRKISEMKQLQFHFYFPEMCKELSGK